MTLQEFTETVLAQYPDIPWEFQAHHTGFEAKAGNDLINWYPWDPTPWAFSVAGLGGCGVTLQQAVEDLTREVTA